MSIQQRSTVTSVSLGCRMKLIKGHRSKNNSKHCASSSHHGVVSSNQNKSTDCDSSVSCSSFQSAFKLLILSRRLILHRCKKHTTAPPANCSDSSPPQLVLKTLSPVHFVTGTVWKPCIPEPGGVLLHSAYW